MSILFSQSYLERFIVPIYIESEISSGYDNNYLIHNYDKEICIPFNFYESHLEDEYTIYENIIEEDTKIIIKKYDDYITLHYECENIINNNNNFLYYNNI